MLKKHKILGVSIIILLIIILCGYKTSTLFEQYGETVLKNTISTRINKSINGFVLDNGEMFTALVHHEYNSQGKLCAIQLDSRKLSALQSGLERAILKSVAEIKSTEFSVPLGNIIGNKLFSGRGPMIKIETVPLASMTCDTVNEFKSVGINHTIHSVGLDFEVSFKAAYPFCSSVFKTCFSVSLCESIIIGEVPSVYVN